MIFFMRPNVLVIAASDPSGGAGVEADIKVLCAHGVNALTAVTAITVQDSRGVRAVQATPVKVFRRILRGLAEDQAIAGVKIGALITEGHVQAVWDFLAGLSPLTPVVLDPVMKATSGPRLLSARAEKLIPSLFPFLALVTPNLPEAQVLTKRPVHDLQGMRAAGLRLCELGAAAALCKGGHLETASRDVLCAQGQFTEWPNRRLPRSFHGTGCVLASAIAARLAQGAELVPAITQSRAYLRLCMKSARPGRGHSFLLDFPPAI